MLGLNKCIPRELDDDMECKIVQFFNHTKNPCEQCKANAKKTMNQCKGRKQGSGSRKQSLRKSTEKFLLDLIGNNNTQATFPMS